MGRWLRQGAPLPRLRRLHMDAVPCMAPPQRDPKNCRIESA